MIGIIVTGTLFILVALYAVIDGTIFQPDSEEPKTIRVNDVWTNKGSNECP